MPELPHIVIVGAGFGGLAAAKKLKGAPVRLTLIDRTNHHLFQPLLYQVATAVLTPGHIGAPIRRILRKQKNAAVLMGEVIGIDKESRRIHADIAERSGVSVDYDYLVLATGARHSYFGHEQYELYAPGLKNLSDAVAIRNNILRALEFAEAEEDPVKREDWLTFVLVGAGPTGVEMAGAIASIRRVIGSIFRHLEASSVRVVLIDDAARVLSGFAERLSLRARQRLVKLGVELRLGVRVEQVDGEGVIAGGQRVRSRTVIWTAGVAPSPAGKWLDAETDRAGRVRVEKDCSLRGHPEVFVIGDVATFLHDGKPLPGLAQVAIQQGRYAAKVIRSRIAGTRPPASFRYFDKGSMAVIGKNFAVLESGRLQFSGFVAWLAWSAVHLVSLAQPGQRLMVLVQWTWTYLTGQPGSGLIVEHYPNSQPSPHSRPGTGRTGDL
ncbi:MAG: NAD(P)/FAD-dependent oxidoreductase [Candidatus Binataceae bacterium]